MIEVRARVHIGACLMAAAEPSEIRGVPERWRLYRVVG